MRPGANGDSWWPAGAPTAAAPARLICLPHAGGGASVFRPWRSAAAPLEVCPLQLPGREGRIRETPFRRMDALVPALIEVLRTSVISPWGIFGYSLGASVAFELVRRAGAAGLPAPAVLAVAAAPAPHRGGRDRALHRLPDREFVAALRGLDGTPEGVLEHRELMDLMLPTLRADFEIHETYRPGGAGGAPPTVDVPILAFGGDADASVSAEELRAWGEVTTAGFRCVTFPAGHFFLSSHGADVLERVRSALSGVGAR